MTDEWWIRKRFEGSGLGWNEVAPRNLYVGTEETHDIPHWYPGEIRTDGLPNTAADCYRYINQLGTYSVEKDDSCIRWIDYFIFLSPFLFISDLFFILFPSFHPSIFSTFFLSYLPSVPLSPHCHFSFHPSFHEFLCCADISVFLLL